MKRSTTEIRAKAIKFGYLIAVLPPVIYWAYWVLHPSIWFNADPAATYFLDSLTVFAGGSYKFVDHPGTPLHLIGSFLLALTRPFFGSQQAFINFHLSRPSIFFFLTNSFLITMNVICVVIFYKTVASTLGRDRMLAGIALSILYFALHRYSFPALTFWSHNSFNFPIGTLWLLWLFHELRKEEVPNRNKLLLLGLAAGIYAVTQIYFTTWLVSGVFTMCMFALRLNKPLKQALASAAWMVLGGILGMFLMFIPIYQEIPRFIGWLLDNVTHQGLYGSGEKGIYTLAMIPLSIRYWWLSIRPMLLVLLLTLLLLGIFVVWYRQSKEKLPASVFAMLLGLLALTGMVLFVMSKAVLRLRFSLSLAAILPLLILVIFKAVEITPWKVAIFKRLFYLASIVAVTIALVQQMQLQQKKSAVETDVPRAKAQALAQLSKQMKVSESDITVVYAFSVPLKCPSLLLASIWEGSFEKEIAALCPNQYVILDAAEGLDADFLTARPIPKIENLDWDMVVWPGTSSHLPDYLYSVGATTIPDSWHVRRNKWFFIHSAVLQN
jgi:hypothetical protein